MIDFAAKSIMLAIILIVLYAFFAFVYWSFNPLTWWLFSDVWGRLLTASIFMLILAKIEQSSD